MRFSSLIALVSATVPVTVLAKGQLGYCISVRFTHNRQCKTATDFEADFRYLKNQAQKPEVFRTYSVLDQPIPSWPNCDVPSAILPAAEAAGVKVVLGLWADDWPSYTKERDALLPNLRKYEKQISALTVGSEGLYRAHEHTKDPSKNVDAGYTATDLLTRINDLKSQVGDIKVGTADTWNMFQDGTADPLIHGGVDLLLVNAFPYWQQIKIENATKSYLDDLQQAFGHIQSISGSTSSPEIWSGETGWPTDGGQSYGPAESSTINAQAFWTEGVCAALDWNINVFYFEAFSEPFKPSSIGDNGDPEDETHWGAFAYSPDTEQALPTSRHQVIPNLSCSYP